MIHCFAPLSFQPSPSAHSLGAQRSGVRSRVGLGECEGPDHAPGGEIGDEAALLLVGPKARIGSVAALVCTATVTPTPASARESSSSTRMYERKSAPAPPSSSGTQTPISPSSPSCANTSPGEGVPAIPAGRVWRDLGVRELAGERLDGALLGSEREVHQAASIVGAMRRPPAFVLLLLLFAVVLSGCGGDDTKRSHQVVESWSQAINASDDETAAGLFAPDAVVIQDGRRTTLKGEAEALAFNSALPCGGKITKTSIDGDEVTATFTLTRRPGHMCDGTGEAAVAVFRIADGKITLWHELPPTQRMSKRPDRRVRPQLPRSLRYDGPSRRRAVRRIRRARRAAAAGAG